MALHSPCCCSRRALLTRTDYQKQSSHNFINRKVLRCYGDWPSVQHPFTLPSVQPWFIYLQSFPLTWDQVFLNKSKLFSPKTNRKQQRSQGHSNCYSKLKGWFIFLCAVCHVLSTSKSKSILILGLYSNVCLGCWLFRLFCLSKEKVMKALTYKVK